jgi:hypothetical protein
MMNLDEIYQKLFNNLFCIFNIFFDKLNILQLLNLLKRIQQFYPYRGTAKFGNGTASMGSNMNIVWLEPVNAMWRNWRRKKAKHWFTNILPIEILKFEWKMASAEMTKINQNFHRCWRLFAASNQNVFPIVGGGGCRQNWTGWPSEMGAEEFEPNDANEIENCPTPNWLKYIN